MTKNSEPTLAEQYHALVETTGIIFVFFIISFAIVIGRFIYIVAFDLSFVGMFGNWFFPLLILLVSSASLDSFSPCVESAARKKAAKRLSLIYSQNH